MAARRGAFAAAGASAVAVVGGDAPAFLTLAVKM